MPQPLPSVEVPDYAPTLNAYQLGRQNFLETQKRDLMKEAGGLAAAGNLSGARSTLYKGGEFGEARQMGDEMRAISSHAKSLDDAKLAKAAKTQELLGNLAGIIKTPEQLEQAKAVLKARGLNADGVTFEQLPMLRQQGISVHQALQNELEERKMAAEQAKATLAQSNSDRTYEAQRSDATQTQLYRNDQLKILADRTRAQAAKATAPKPLTEAQSSARYFSGMMDKAEPNISSHLAKNEGDKVLETSPPVSSRALSIYLNSANWMGSSLLSKQEKQYLQAADSWIRAKLRKESGASIPPDESLGEFKAFIPLSDDDMQTRRQKNEMRKAARSGFDAMGGVNAPGAPDAPDAGDGDDFKIINVE